MNKKPPTEEDFAALMPGVKRLENDRVNLLQQRPLKKIKSQSGEVVSRTDFSELNFNQQKEITDTYFDHGIQRKLQRRIRQGLMPINDNLDLHGHTQKTALTELGEFFEHAQLSQFKTVIVVHGKGNRSSNFAVLKPLVHLWLSQQSFVLAWCPAQPAHGGSGASYVYLR